MVNLENKAHPYYIKGLLVLNLASHFYVVMTKVKAYFICWRQCKLREESWMLLTWCPLVLCPPAAPLYRRKKPQADTKGEEYLVPQPATSVSAVEQYGFNILFFPLCWIPSCLRTLPLKYISLSCRNIVLITTVSIFNDQCSCLRSQKKEELRRHWLWDSRDVKAHPMRGELKEGRTWEGLKLLPVGAQRWRKIQQPGQAVLGDLDPSTQLPAKQLRSISAK